jgi:hypothetical protein
MFVRSELEDPEVHQKVKRTGWWVMSSIYESCITTLSMLSHNQCPPPPLAWLVSLLTLSMYVETCETHKPMVGLICHMIDLFWHVMGLIWHIKGLFWNTIGGKLWDRQTNVLFLAAPRQIPPVFWVTSRRCGEGGGGGGGAGAGVLTNKSSGERKVSTLPITC